MARRIALGLVGLALVAALPAAASTFLALDDQQLVEGSRAVVEGKVLSVESFWNAEGTAILTEAVVEVDDLIAGESPAVVRVRTFGGQVGNYVIEAHGFPRFEEGERLLLFLNEEKADRSIRVTGYQQGQFRIRTDEKGHEMAVPAVDEGFRMFYADGRKAKAPEARSLEAFKSEIRELAQAQQ